MKKLPWIIAILSIAALLLWGAVALTAKSKTLADVTSPSGDWRLVVRVSVGILDLPKNLAAGKVFEVQDDEFFVGGITYFWLDTKTNQGMIGGHNKNFSMRLEVEEVTEQVVTGELVIVGTDPQVDLSGRFRLVNTITPFPN